MPIYELAALLIDELICDMADDTWPIEVRSLGRTLKRWRDQITAWHTLHIANGPTESMNNLAACEEWCSDSALSRTTESAPCSGPESQIGFCSRRSHHAEVRSSGKAERGYQSVVHLDLLVVKPVAPTSSTLRRAIGAARARGLTCHAWPSAAPRQALLRLGRPGTRKYPPRNSTLRFATRHTPRRPHRANPWRRRQQLLRVVLAW